METAQTLPASTATLDYKGKYQLAQTNNKTTYNSEEKIDFTYKSKDGDTLTINATRTTSLTYTKNGTFKDAHVRILTPEEGEKLRSSLKQELIDYKEELLKKFVEANGGDWKDIDPTTGEVTDEDVTALEAQMPEYWSAENTAQRIVDFATSFFSSYEGEDAAEFFKKARAAIEDGFGQALKELGELPGVVGKLIDKTHRLISEKLDAFEKQVTGGEPVAVAA
ncbi:MAG: DUF5610 domain-containing protein [Fibrobacteres bacterium]|nr:DUF5610 domain-containing protein [Fibrobacterota bacterium]